MANLCSFVINEAWAQNMYKFSEAGTAVDTGDGAESCAAPAAQQRPLIRVGINPMFKAISQLQGEQSPLSTHRAWGGTSSYPVSAMVCRSYPDGSDHMEDVLP